jgi:hypothetical protein
LPAGRARASASPGPAWDGAPAWLEASAPAWLGSTNKRINELSPAPAYQLHQPDEGREAKLLAALEVFEDRCHALNSIWFISTPWTAEQIDAYLRHFLTPEDSLLVEKLPVGKGWSGWVGQDVKDWLLRHLGPSS